MMLVTDVRGKILGPHFGPSLTGLINGYRLKGSKFRSNFWSQYRWKTRLSNSVFVKYPSASGSFACLSRESIRDTLAISPHKCKIFISVIWAWAITGSISTIVTYQGWPISWFFLSIPLGPGRELWQGSVRRAQTWGVVPLRNGKWSFTKMSGFNNFFSRVSTRKNSLCSAGVKW